MSPLLPEETDIPFHDVNIPEQFSEDFLQDTDAHIWLIPVQPGKCDGLSASEQERAARFHQTADADRFRSARRALRRLAGAYLGIPPATVEITGARHEKPVIGNKVPAPLHFNVSHSGQLAMIAFGRQPLGADIEQVNPELDLQDLLQTQFTEDEQSAVAAAADRPAAFFRLWTRKEAITKALGTGLASNLAALPVLTDELTAGETGAVRQLLSVKTLPGYAAALALTGRIRGISLYREI